MNRVGSKLILRVLSDDQPDDVADTIRNWVDQEMRSREHSERDTEIVLVIGMDVAG